GRFRLHLPPRRLAAPPLALPDLGLSAIRSIGCGLYSWPNALPLGRLNAGGLPVSEAENNIAPGRLKRSSTALRTYCSSEISSEASAGKLTIPRRHPASSENTSRRAAGLNSSRRSSVSSASRATSGGVFWRSRAPR